MTTEEKIISLQAIGEVMKSMIYLNVEERNVLVQKMIEIVKSLTP